MNGLNLTIRTVLESDAAAIVTLLNPIIEAGTFTAMETPFSIDDQLAFLRDFPEQGVYHAAVDSASGQIVGIQDVLPNLDEIGEFSGVGEISTFVALGFHRRGIGSRLCEATFDAARKKGYSRLQATIRADNLQAILFYAQQRFRVLSEKEVAILASMQTSERIVAERILT